MSVLKKLARNLTSALFTRALGDVFEWGPSVPAGDRPCYTPDNVANRAEPLREVGSWANHNGPRAAIG